MEKKRIPKKITSMTLRTNYIFIDHENVPLDSVALLNREDVRLLVFVGSKQSKISVEAAAAIQQLGSKAEYVKISGAGPNALDFHIAFYLGRLVGRDQTACFHVISNDKGFDPLIAHLKDQSVYAARRSSISDIPLLKATIAGNPLDRARLFISKLRQPGATKPKKIDTLSRAINALFQKQLSDEDVAAVVRELQKLGEITVDGKAVQHKES